MFAVKSRGSQTHILKSWDVEVAMNKLTLKFPTSFGEASKQVLVRGYHVASPDLQNLSDRCLADMGLTRCRTNFEAIKPSWLA